MGGELGGWAFGWLGIGWMRSWVGGQLVGGEVENIWDELGEGNHYQNIFCTFSIKIYFEVKHSFSASHSDGKGRLVS